MSQIFQLLQYTAPRTAEVVTTDTQMRSNLIYIVDFAGLVTLTLPAESAVGDIVGVTGINNPNGWKIAQNAGQVIHIVDTSTTTGTAGSLASSSTYDSIRLICVVGGSSSEWNALSIMGNLTIT